MTKGVLHLSYRCRIFALPIRKFVKRGLPPALFIFLAFGGRAFIPDIHQTDQDMQRIILLLLAVWALTLPCPSQTEPPKQPRAVFADPAETMPQYPGGTKALFAFIGRNLRYPPEMVETDVQGRVGVSFIVTKSGRCKDFKVIRSLDPWLDREALRVLRKMPRWKPGTRNGRPVRMKYVVPVMFRLQ